MPSNLRFFIFGIAVAFMVGAALLLGNGWHLPGWGTYALAGLVVCSAYLFRRRRPTGQPAEDPNTLRPGSRRWARAMYHNGWIDIAELDAYYRNHPHEN